MTGSEDPRTSLAEMALAIHEEESVVETVELVLDFARSAVGCSQAGVVFVHAKGRIESVASTDLGVDALHAREMVLGDGPDLSIAPDHTSVVVHDTRRERRWPGWAAAAEECGLRSMIGVRLYTGQRTLGSLNLYDHRPDRFSAEDLQVAHVLARHAALALSRVQESANLRQAIDARKLIGQAQGILMERYDLDDARAFEVLRRYSQNANTKLRDVAQLIVDTRLLPGEASDL
ncbi:GAF and ANTAR domain-containing protein [Nocardioides cynanchi]|uniref:GAF and ANTAR domain-containing protein n=1 Tax=Nocardioides cynanchi TaxID=2558918 RepID=UPI001EE338DE|nr:GAF and ANTAR domain-containing protein [Nocardioides cynanchi]